MAVTARALARTAAVRRMELVNREEDPQTLEGDSEAADGDGIGTATDAEPVPPVSIDDIFTPHDPGPWPEGFRCSREELYGDDGR